MDLHKASLLVALGLLAGACHPTRGARHALTALDARHLSGIWVGVQRDQPEPGIRRSTALMLELKATDQGAVAGRVELQGGLGSGLARKLMCTDGRRASLSQTAMLSEGRFDKTSARWRLTKPSLDGVKGCQHRFPLGQRCRMQLQRDGHLQLSCGALRLSVRRQRLAGVWVWDEERTDRSGDTVIGRLRLHLSQTGDQLRGFMDDIRERVSGDGQRFRCNGRLRYDQQARHQVVGRLRGRRVTLHVRSTQPKRSPCQGQVEVPAVLSGLWSPLENRLTLTLGGDERVLWRRPASSAPR